MDVHVLTCPVCDRSLVQRDVSTEFLRADAREHLRTHRLSESKHAIYGVMMTRRRDRLTADAEPDTLGEWVEAVPELA